MLELEPLLKRDAMCQVLYFNVPTRWPIHTLAYASLMLRAVYRPCPNSYMWEVSGIGESSERRFCRCIISWVSKQH